MQQALLLSCEKINDAYQMIEPSVNVCRTMGDFIFTQFWAFYSLVELPKRGQDCTIESQFSLSVINLDQNKLLRDAQQNEQTGSNRQRKRALTM